jgi:hypothetical protein
MVAQFIRKFVASWWFLFCLQFPFLSIQVHVEDEVLAIKPRGDTTAPDEIVVCGANVGLTTTFHVREPSGIS